MGVKTYSDIDENTKYKFYRKGGRSIIERRPVFSPDGESVLLIVENIVRVYNIQTGDCIRTLETENTVKELVTIQFLENEAYNLYGCSDQGCVTIWTWEKGAVLREIALKIPKDWTILTFNLLNNDECFLTADTSNIKLHLGTYSLKTGDLLHCYNNIKVYYHDIISVSVGWCSGERFAAISNGTKYLFIQNLLQPHIVSEIVNYNSLRIMCVAAHHRESSVAINDTLGRTTIIRGNLYDKKNIAREILHWHNLPPLAICFSVQGNCLYTGGMEKVLVKWTIGGPASKANEKMFIPRLPGMIRYITTNNVHIAVTLTNNSVVIANSQMRVVSTILECGGLSPITRALGSSLIYHKPLGALFMPGRTGHLQLFSTTSHSVLYNVDITEMNNLPPERHNLLPLETEVTCAAISSNGHWLVTSEYRNDGVTYPEERLKFWFIEARKTLFKLNTCVNMSHNGCNIVSLAIDHKGEFCVSAGTDQKIRIWKKEKQKSYSWVCLTACYYSSGTAQFLAPGMLNDFKNNEEVHMPGVIESLPYMREIRKNDIIKRLFNIHKEHSLHDEKIVKMCSGDNSEFEMGGVAISQDGSLVAAWFGCKLTLWDTHLSELRTSLSHPALRPKGVHVQFGSQDAAHYLACTTKDCVAVWSLLSLTVKWLVQISTTCLVADPFSNKMAVATTDNDVYIFRPQNSTPILVKQRLLDPKTGVFKQCTFASTSRNDTKLYLMRNDSEIYCLEQENEQQDQLEVVSRHSTGANASAGTSAFSALLAERRLTEVRAPHPAPTHHLDTDSLATTALDKFLSAAPHMLPSLNLLCTSFLHHIAGQVSPEDRTEEIDIKEEKTEIASASSDEEDISSTRTNAQHTTKSTELWMPNYEKVKEKRMKRIQKELNVDLHETETIFGI